VWAVGWARGDNNQVVLPEGAPGDLLTERSALTGGACSSRSDELLRTRLYVGPNSSTPCRGFPAPWRSPLEAML
jgi:hypothetical protein